MFECLKDINTWLLYTTLHRDKFCAYLVFTPKMQESDRPSNYTPHASMLPHLQGNIGKRSPSQLRTPSIHQYRLIYNEMQESDRLSVCHERSHPHQPKPLIFIFRLCGSILLLVWGKSLSLSSFQENIGNP